jgi:PTS system ascorbate-specific IIA component
MIGVLIVSHGTLGESLLHCAAHVLGGPVPQLEQLNVAAKDDPNLVLPQLQDMVARLDQGDGVLILSDIYGATPTNIVCRLLEPGKVEGVAGVNLPMLIRALTYRNEPLPAMVQKAISGGIEGVVHITSEVCRVA